MVHRIIWRVSREQALEFWAERLGAEGISTEQEPSALLFSDPEGLDLEIAIDETHDAPLRAESPEIPPECALLGFEGVRAYTGDQEASHYLLTGALRFSPLADNAGYRLRGGSREALYHYDPAPPVAGVQGAGTVHHIAWASGDADHVTWRKRVIDEGVQPTEVIDRLYFRSIYFREPSGVLFEIATLGPGFATDEDAEHLGERLILPPDFEHLRAQVEPLLTPLPDPRENWTRA